MNIHLIRNSKKLFDLRIVMNGNLALHSNQGYERKAGCYKVIRAMAKSMGQPMILFQDDTFETPQIWRIMGKSVEYMKDSRKKKYSATK